jgi:hypothetical protein
MAIATNEKNMNGCGKLNCLKMNAVPRAPLTETPAVP